MKMKQVLIFKYCWASFRQMISKTRFFIKILCNFSIGIADKATVNFWIKKKKCRRNLNQLVLLFCVNDKFVKKWTTELFSNLQNHLPQEIYITNTSVRHFCVLF